LRARAQDRGTTLRSIGQISRQQRLLDNDAEFVTPQTCWPSCATTTCSSRPSCARRTTCATAQRCHDDLLENWIDEATAHVVPVRSQRAGLG